MRFLPGVVRTPQLVAQRDELIRQSLAALGAELEQTQARGLGGVARRLAAFALRASGHLCVCEAPDFGFDLRDRPAQSAHLQGRRVQLALLLIGFLTGARRDVERDAQPHGHGRRPAGLSDALELHAERAVVRGQRQAGEAHFAGKLSVGAAQLRGARDERTLPEDGDRLDLRIERCWLHGPLSSTSAAGA